LEVLTDVLSLVGVVGGVSCGTGGGLQTA